jgi:hypothetical protein
LSSARNSASLGSIQCSAIYTSSLDTEIFMIKVSICMSSIELFWLETNERIVWRAVG